MRNVDSDSDDGGLVSDEEQAYKMVTFSCGGSLCLPMEDVCQSGLLSSLDMKDNITLPINKLDYEDAIAFVKSTSWVHAMWNKRLPPLFNTLLYLEYDENMLLDKAYACAADSCLDLISASEMRERIGVDHLNLPPRCIPVFDAARSLEDSTQRERDPKAQELRNMYEKAHLEITSKWNVHLFMYCERSLDTTAMPRDVHTQVATSPHLYYELEEEYVFLGLTKSGENKNDNNKTYNIPELDDIGGIFTHSSNGIPGYRVALEILFEPVVDISYSYPKLRTSKRLYWCEILGLPDPIVELLGFIYCKHFGLLRDLVYMNIMKKVLHKGIQQLLFGQHVVLYNKFGMEPIRSE